MEIARRNLSSTLKRADLPEDVRKELEEAEVDLRTPLETDRWIYRAVVIVLGVVVVATVLGGIYIEIIGKGADTMTLPQAVVSIGSAAIGALAGLLAPSPAGGGK